MDKLFQVITDNLPSHYNNAHHNLTLIRTNAAYTAPELNGKYMD